jgi:antitoxin component of MazEF toxin-antitoxin module
MATIRKLYKQGNSVVLSVPGWLMELVDMQLGCDVLMEKVDGEKALLVRRWNPPTREDELQIKDGDRHHLSG